jgi:hypothetical protein
VIILPFCIGNSLIIPNQLKFAIKEELRSEIWDFHHTRFSRHEKVKRKRVVDFIISIELLKIPAKNCRKEYAPRKSIGI